MATRYCPACRDSVSSDDPSCPWCTLGRPAEGWPRDPYIGRLIDGKYRIDRRLGAGGMGFVFLATHLHGKSELGQVVVKYLSPDLAENPVVRQRFVNEAKAAREVGSPHVVKVFDLGFDVDGVPFLVMEHVGGQSLAALLGVSGALKPGRAVHIAMQLAQAMEECHEKGILHRDLKPDNVLIQAQRTGPFVKIIDFGIARMPEAGGTLTGAVLGTPQYMAPEQILGRPLDGGVDIYALGVMLFEMIAGEPPARGDPADPSPNKYIDLNLHVPARRLSEVVSDVPDALVELVDRMLAKGRAARPASMGEVFRDLCAVAEDRGWVALGARAGATYVGSTAPDPRPVTEIGAESLGPRAARARRRRWLGAAAAGTLAGGLVLSAYFLGGSAGPAAPAGSRPAEAAGSRPAVAVPAGEAAPVPAPGPPAAQAPSSTPVPPADPAPEPASAPGPAPAPEPASAPSPAPPRGAAPEPDARALLSIRCNVEGAEILVDGRSIGPVGEGGLRHAVEPGRRVTVVCRKDGFDPSSRRVAPRPGAVHEVSLEIWPQ